MSARILHIAYSGVGGVGQLAVELALRADRRRFQSAVCFFGEQPVWPSYCQRLDEAGVEWADVPLRRRTGSLWRLLRTCLRLRPDVAVAHGPSHALVLPFLRAARPALKAITVFHGPPVLAQNSGGILRFLPGLAASNHVICVGPHLAILLARNLRCTATVIRSGVTIPPVPPQSNSGELLMVGNLSPAKDHFTLLEAAALLARRRNHFRVVLVGDGVLRRDLERRTQRLGLDNLVEFTGSLPPEQRNERLGRASVFVYATHGEGGYPPLAVQEAMAAARPIVATRVPGVAGGLENGKTALLVPPADAAALAGAMETLLSDPETSASLGQEARRAAEQHHSIAACVASYEAVFGSLLQPDAARIPTTGLAGEFCGENGDEQRIPQVTDGSPWTE